MVLDFSHRRTSKKLLEITWDDPPSLEIRAPSGHTVAAARMAALPLAEALARIAGKDPRPLLVLRECSFCKGSDDALLSRKLSNERTELLTRWFHCVRLKPNVLEANHTYHALFAGPRPPHLFLCRTDGSRMVTFDGRQSQTGLWKEMKRLLRSEYRKDAEKAVKEIFRLMATFDHLDQMESQLREQIEAELEARGPRSRRLKRLRAKLAKYAAQRKRAEGKQAKVSDLGIVRDPSKS